MPKARTPKYGTAARVHLQERRRAERRRHRVRLAARRADLAALGELADRRCHHPGARREVDGLRRHRHAAVARPERQAELRQAIGAVAPRQVARQVVVVALGDAVEVAHADGAPLARRPCRPAKKRRKSERPTIPARP
jgi:hypothetical protein